MSFDDTLRDAVLAALDWADQDEAPSVFDENSLRTVLKRSIRASRIEAIFSEFEERVYISENLSGDYYFTSHFFKDSEKLRDKTRESAPDFDDGGWEPLPIEVVRSDEFETQRTILSGAIDEISENNGFAVAEPEIRNNVISALRAGEKLVSDSSIHPDKTLLSTLIVEPLRFITRHISIGALAAAAQRGLDAFFKMFLGNF